MANFDNISDSAAGFAKSLMAMADYADQGMEKIIRKACIDLYRRIAERTVRDTGRAAASWNLTTEDTNATMEAGKYSSDEIARIINEKSNGLKTEISDGSVWITNNLDYIEPLENGSSKRMPNGMVMVSLAEFESHFNQALAGMQGFEATI